VLLAAACTDRKAGILLEDPDAAQPTPTLEPAPSTIDTTSGPEDSATPEPATTPVSQGNRSDVAIIEDGRELVALRMPLINSIELPPIGELARTGQLAEDRLGGLVTTAISGVDIVAASCAAEGGELVYGDTGDDIFESDGSGRLVEESDDGLTTLTVEADGSGQFYDENKADKSLLTVKVNPDQSGEYFNERGSTLTTILVAPDRTGEFFRQGDSFKTTVLIRPDGSGEYFDQQPSGLLTIKAQGDGSGEYFFENDDSKVTLLVRSDQSWQLTDRNSERRIEVTVTADGSGTYVRRAFDPLVFEFDSNGDGVDGQRPVRFQRPETPVFSVAASFPPLGKFGALQPPCATVIRFDAQLLFDFGKADIREEAAETLDEVVETLNEIGKPIEVNGHTDARGSDDRNLALSLERANAVLDELEARDLAVEVEVNGFGESQPIAPNETPDGEDDPSGRALNRRVEIVIRE